MAAVLVQLAELKPVTVYEAVAVGVKATLFVTPPVHVYVLAPDPLRTAVPLVHTV